MRLTVLLLAASVLALTACTKETKEIRETIVEKEVPADRQASPVILDSFQKPAQNLCDQASCIKVQKSSLGKIFLLLASGKTAGSTPQWYDLKPLVVSFEKSGKKLALLAENYTSIYEEIKTVNLIQTFDVISEDADSVTFDWGPGLKTLVLQSSYDVDDVRGNRASLTESSFNSIPVVDSFVRGIKFDEKNIELEQISKIRMDGIKSENQKVSLEIKEETLAMNIQIRAYNPGKNFLVKEADKERRAGFFVTKLSKVGHSQEVRNLITKWDISDERGPIVVRISSAVPQEYLQAVTEGVLYWNKVFGKEALVVKTGVDPQAGPEDRSVMLRWIPWLDSGAAYAIGQSDPLTGEVLRAQVFMPSVFTSVGSADQVDLNNGVPVAVGAVACDLGPAMIAMNKIAKEAPGSQRLRIAQDAVRSTVAHEMGHALGLRHNFAGSFSAKVSATEVRDSAKTYLKNPYHQGLETSTSIMDYVSGIDNILMAARLKFASLSYEKMAMDWAYSEGDKALDTKISRYCTDDDISLGTSQGLQIYGCERFDLGNNPLMRKVLDARDERTQFVEVLFTSILGRLFPADNPQQVNDLVTVLKDSARWSKLNVADLKFASQVILENTQNKTAAPAFASLDALKKGQILVSKMGLDPDLEKERLRSINEMNGYAGVLDLLWRNDDGTLGTQWLQEQIEELKNSTYLVSGKTLGGREYQLTEDQQKKIVTFFESLVAGNRRALVDGLAILLPKLDQKTATGAVVESKLGKGLMDAAQAEALYDLYADLLNESEGTVTAVVGVQTSGTAKTIVLPKRYLNEADRLVWANLISSKALGFNVEMKKALVVQALGSGINEVVRNVQPTFDIALQEKPEELANSLLQAGLINAAGSQWLKAEIATWMALGKLL